MSFGLSMRGVPYVQSYQDAEKMYERAERLRRGSDAGEFALPDRPFSRITAITQRADGSIEFSYHRTDVVIWRPGGSCVVDLSWSSRSTQTFANRFVPGRICVECDCRLIRDNDGAIRQPGRRVTISPDMSISGTLPFRVLRLNRKRMNAALRVTGFSEFREWFTPHLDFWGDALHRSAEDISWSEAFSILADRTRWEELLRKTPIPFSRASDLIPAFRTQIAREHDCYDVTERDIAPSYATAVKWAR